MNSERKCMFCGCDISHLRANATICGSSKCKHAYDIWRKTKPKEKRFCEICGDPIDDLPGQRRICKKESCIKEQARRKYKSKLINKTCSECGKLFSGTYKQNLCESCRDKAKEDTINKLKSVIKNAEIIEQSIRCKHCGKEVNKRKVKNLSNTKLILFDGVCEDCKKINNQRTSERMKKNNPNPWIGKPKKKAKKKKPKYKNSSERMKKDNPMFKKEIRLKMSKTLREGYESGRIAKRKGVNSPLWKGNRNLNKSVRIELKDWVKSKLKKANYTCQICGKTNTTLHVHHIIPLRDIIDRFITLNNYTINYLNAVSGTDIYFAFIKKIVDYHFKSPGIGIVICSECHQKVDIYYRRKTSNKKEKKLKKVNSKINKLKKLLKKHGKNKINKKNKFRKRN